MRLPPLPMRPVFVEKLWGGARLAALPAKQRHGHRPPGDVGVGESWEVADLPEGQSTVDDDPICAPFAGKTLREMVQTHGVGLVGTAHPPERFPILVKLIDAAEDLSVQVHPGDDYAATHPGTFSKDEAWLIIDSAVGARVLHGFVDGVSRARFAEAVGWGLPHELMRSAAVKRGDVLHVPPGVVHAIGAGVVVLEVQEPSDTTFRVWDFDRKDAHGKKRALHIDEALAVARFSDDSAQPPLLQTRQPHPLGATLVENRRFSMREVAVSDEGVEFAVDDRSAVVAYAVDVDVDVVWQGQVLVLPVGGSCILPASCGGVRFVGRGAAGHVIVMA